MFEFFKKMAFSILILLIGIPGSGKTTWAKQYKKEHPFTNLICTDEIRKEIFGKDECPPEYNQMIRNEAHKRVKKILDDNSPNGRFGPEIVVDSTNCDVEEWIKYKNLGPSIIVARVFDATPEEAIKRQKNRERKVPEDAIRGYYETLQKNKQYLPKIFNFIY